MKPDIAERLVQSTSDKLFAAGQSNADLRRRIAQLERQRSQMVDTALVAIDDGIKSGAVLWREALERVVQIGKDSR